MEQQVGQNETNIKANKKAIQENAYIRNKFKIEEAIKRRRNEIRILGSLWTIDKIRPKSKTGDKAKEYSDREEFTNKLIKSVFINYNLLSQAQWEREGSSIITDIKPVNMKGKSGSGLDMSFANTELRNNIMDGLGGVRMPYFLRPALPNILNDRYNELLCDRADIRKAAGGERKLFVDLFPFSPYLQLRERRPDAEERSVHSTVAVVMIDPRLDNPITHYHDYRCQPRATTQPVGL
jgi:hypothetical protein